MSLAKLEQLKNEIYVKHISSMLDDLKEERTGIHVSDLVHKCLRRAYLSIINRDRPIDDREQEITTKWIGKKLHQQQLTDKHEFKVEYRGVKGSIDEIIETDFDICIIDRKTTRNVPLSPYESHTEQEKYYTFMYAFQEKKLYKKLFYATLYLDVNNSKSTIYVFPIDNIMEIKKELDDKINVLEPCITNKIVPPSVRSNECEFCPYLVECIELDKKRIETV